MRARLVALLAAAVLGTAGGAVTAVVTTADPAPAGRDPLRLGVDLVDQPCSGESLLVLGFGDNAAPLAGSASEAGARYLRTDDSCRTVLGPEGQAAPAYVVYTGPYETLTEPCELRMTPEHRADFVAVLREGRQDLVKCPCVLPPSAAPDLTPLMDATAEESVWIRALQSMLHDFDSRAFPRAQITGRYDAPTVARVTELQEVRGGVASRPGYVDEATWSALTDRICKIYDF